MNFRTKLFAIVMAATLIFTLLTVAGYAANLELVNQNAGTDVWDLLEDTWSGVLTNTSGVVTSRVVNEQGQLVITGCGDSANGTKDNWLGNYIGIGKYLKANTEYTVTVNLKFDAGLSDQLHVNYPNSYVDLWILYHDADFTTTMPTRDATVITDTNGEFVEYTYTFTTGDESSLAAGYLQVGPHGAGQNHYWGGFCPTATLVIDSCILTGDLVGVAEDTPPVDNPPVDNPPVDNPPVDTPTENPGENEGAPNTSDFSLVVVLGALGIVALGAELSYRKKYNR